MATTWDYPTNFSNGTTVENLGTLMQYANYVAEGWLAYGFLLIIFMMSFGVGALSGSRKALLASSFITFIFSVYFLRLDMINPALVFVLIIGIIVGMLGAKEGKY